MEISPERQRIVRLTPLAEVLERIAAITHAVTPHMVEASKAKGLVLASDVIAAQSLPRSTVALADGWAVAADTVADAIPYAPVPLASAPIYVETGMPMPPGTDAVLPPDAVVMRGAMAEAL